MISRRDLAPLVDAWEQGKDETETPAVRAMIREETARIHREFDKLPIRVKFVDHDPYHSFEQMRDQVASTGTMLVWKGASVTPLWDEKTNWMARAVHDFEHIVVHADFGMDGEAFVTRQAIAKREKLAPLYLSEVMLQAAVANYRGNFAEQKLVLLSPSMQRYALSLRGLNGTTSHIDRRDLVWTIAGMLEQGSSPKLVMVHLGAMGVPEADALVVLDAAQNLNRELKRGL